jgi:hypothetical protein
MKPLTMRSAVRVTVASAAAVAFLLFTASAAQARGTITGPCCFDYGTIAAGSTKSQTFELFVTGKGSNSGITITLTGSAAFAITSDGCTGATITSKKPCFVTVQYAPTTAGESDTATLTFTTTKPDATGSIALTGKAAPSPPPGRQLFWANQNGNTIGRANVDGTAANQSFITGATAPYGVAVDSNFVYWTNFNAATIARANLDGTGVNQSFIPAPAGPEALAVDSNHIYWANTGANTIGRANLDGTGVNQSFIAAGDATHHPIGVAVDSGHVYWTLVVPDLSFGSGTIGRANLDGTGANLSFITGTSISVGEVAVNPG